MNVIRIVFRKSNILFYLFSHLYIEKIIYSLIRSSLNHMIKISH